MDMPPALQRNRTGVVVEILIISFQKTVIDPVAGDIRAKIQTEQNPVGIFEEESSGWCMAADLIHQSVLRYPHRSSGSDLKEQSTHPRFSE